jgi:hypothetical protein
MKDVYYASEQNQSGAIRLHRTTLLLLPRPSAGSERKAAARAPDTLLFYEYLAYCASLISLFVCRVLPPAHRIVPGA